MQEPGGALACCPGSVRRLARSGAGRGGHALAAGPHTPPLGCPTAPHPGIAHLPLPPLSAPAARRPCCLQSAARVAATVLTRAAVDRGSRDNVTVVIVDLSPMTPAEIEAEAQLSEVCVGAFWGGKKGGGGGRGRLYGRAARTR